MVSKEDFNKVWKDSSRENILNQFYYEHNELFRIKKEVREYIEKIPNEDNSTESQKIAGTYVIRNVILEILDKGE